MITCELVQYRTKTRRETILSNETCEAQYIISTTSFQYPIYSEKFTYEFYNFLASLGGLLGIYLGIDLILFFDWFFKLKRWIFAIFWSKNPRRMSTIAEVLENRSRVIFPAMDLESFGGER